MNVTIEGHEIDLQHLRTEVDSLRAELGRKADRNAVRELDDRLENAEATVRGLQHDTREHEGAIEDLREDLRTEVGDLRTRYDRAVSSIGRQLAWFERHIRATTPQSTALDIDHGLARLADVAENGRRREALLLSSSARAAYEDVIQRDDDARRQSARCRRAAIQASAVIADTEPADPRHVAAATEFQTAYATTTVLEQRREAAQDALDRSRTALLEDDQLHAAHDDTIAVGTRADADLRTRLRTRLVQATHEGVLLPVWFTSVMGMSPPPDAEEWLATGVDLTVYRATYGITHPVVALGPAPDVTTKAPRRSWYRSLQTRTYRYTDPM